MLPPTAGTLAAAGPAPWDASHLRKLALGVGRQRVVRALALQVDVVLPQAAHEVQLGGDVDHAGGAARLRGAGSAKRLGGARAEEERGPQASS